MKTVRSLSITLLLAFLAFTFLHTHQLPANSHTISKAVISLEDSLAKAQWGDEKKQPFHLEFLLVLTLLFCGVIIRTICLPTDFERTRLFLLPVFHQSNYVILPPAN